MNERPQGSKVTLESQARASDIIASYQYDVNENYHVSSEQINPYSCLGYIGQYTTQLRVYDYMIYIWEIKQTMK